MAQKSIAYFPKQVALNGSGVLKDFLKGAIKHGIVPVENSMDADYAVIWSVLWNGKMTANQRVYEHYRHFNKPVFVIDVGALHREVTWKVALNNINAHGYYGHELNLDPDRPKTLGISLRTQTRNNGKILIAAQHRRSQQVKDVNIEQWTNQMYNKITSITDRPVVIRPHPRCNLDLYRLPMGAEIQQPVKIPNSYDKFYLEYDWYAIVNYNSGPGIQGALNGCHVIVNDSSLAFPVSTTLENPVYTPRDEWLISIAHTEYTREEIKQGLCLKRLAERL